MLVILLPLILAACGSEPSDVGEDRKFANDPVTEQAPTETAEVHEDATPVVDAPVVSASPETLLLVRGTPHTLYTLVHGELLSLYIQDGESNTTSIPLPEGYRILAFEGSPSGDRVAVLLVSDSNTLVSLAFFHSTGIAIGTPVEVLTPAGATPVAGAGEPDWGSYAVTWSPQGTNVLVMNSSRLESVPVAGEPEPISLDGLDGRLVNAARSPQGSRAFLQFALPDGSQRVLVREMESGKTREARPLSTEAGHGLDDVQWLPDGSGLMYVQGQIENGIMTHGQLNVYVLGQERARPIATSGQGGPSGNITHAVVSPDGKSALYVVSIRDGDSWVFHSMWIRALHGNASYQVPAGVTGVVTDVAWVDRGIAWMDSPTPEEPGTIFVMHKGGEPEVVFRPDSVIPSPVASPASTPGATPVRSPGATPVASPGATPGMDATPVSTP